MFVRPAAQAERAGLGRWTRRHGPPPWRGEPRGKPRTLPHRPDTAGSESERNRVPDQGVVKPVERELAGCLWREGTPRASAGATTAAGTSAASRTLHKCIFAKPAHTNWAVSNSSPMDVFQERRRPLLIDGPGRQGALGKQQARGRARGAHDWAFRPREARGDGITLEPNPVSGVFAVNAGATESSVGEARMTFPEWSMGIQGLVAPAGSLRIGLFTSR